MNVKRFTARTSRDALSLVRQAFGADAVVLSTRPCAEGVEVLAMAPESVPQIERVSAEAAAAPAARRLRQRRAPLLPVLRRPVLPSAGPTRRPTAPAPTTVEQDVAQLSMSTLSFQDYVRERMLRRRRAEQQAQPGADRRRTGRGAGRLAQARPAPRGGQPLRDRAAAAGRAPSAPRPPPVLHETARHALPRRSTARRSSTRRRREPRTRASLEQTRCSTSCVR